MTGGTDAKTIDLGIGAATHHEDALRHPTDQAALGQVMAGGEISPGVNLEAVGDHDLCPHPAITGIMAMTDPLDINTQEVITAILMGLMIRDNMAITMDIRE